MPPKTTKKKKSLSHAQKMLQAQKARTGEGELTTNTMRATQLSASQGMATTVFTVDALDLKSTKVPSRGGGGDKKTRGIGSRNAHKKGVQTTFAKEADYDVERRVKDARRPIGTAPKAYEELDVVVAKTKSATTITSDYAIIVEHQSVEAIDFMPRRPKWSRKGDGKETSKNRLRLRERKAFAKWARRVKEKMVAKGGYPPAFEQNLEVWRQLWRAMERADVICCVLDARNPMLHFPAALYAHATRVHKKPLICALNKIDRVPREAAEKWRKCLLEGLPGLDEVIGFIAVEQDEDGMREEEEGEEEEEEELDEEELAKRVYEPTREMTVGKSALISAVKRVAKYGKRWKHVVEDDPHEDEDSRLHRTKTKNYAFFEDEFENIHGEDDEGDDAPKDECVVALVGHPNVGKSSMINTLLGRKAVSVKATPGHTKTLQTLRFAKGVWLCDSPGLVFPRVDASLPEQIVGGIVPLPIVREPYSSLRWLAEMRDACKDRWKAYADSKTSNEKDRRLAEELSKTLPETLKISALPTDLYDSEVLELRDASDVLEGFLPWSPLSLARETALKRKLLVSGGRPDDRAGGVIALKRVLDGKSPYAVPPPIDIVAIKARRDSAHAPFAGEDLNIENEEGFEEELEEMNRNDNGLILAEDGGGGGAHDALDLIDYFDDEDPCFDPAPKKVDIKSNDDDSDESEGDERNSRKAGPSNAFAALSLDEDD